MKLGNIVEYIDPERIMCAVILEVRSQRLRLVTENNKEVNLSASRLVRRDRTRLDLTVSRTRMVLWPRMPRSRAFSWQIRSTLAVGLPH